MDRLAAIEQATELAREYPGRSYSIIERPWAGIGCFVAETRSIYKGDTELIRVVGEPDPISGKIVAHRTTIDLKIKGFDRAA